MSKSMNSANPNVLATAIAAALATAFQQQNRKAAAKQQKAKRDTSPEGKAQRVAEYEASVIKGLNAKGIKSADIQLRVNVLPYKGWLEKGRVVRKGEHGVKGLFHISQTDVLPASQTVTPATTEQTAG